MPWASLSCGHLKVSLTEHFAQRFQVFILFYCIWKGSWAGEKLHAQEQNIQGSCGKWKVGEVGKGKRSQ